MKHFIGIAVCLLLSVSAYGQTYSYSFKGELTTEDINGIEKRCTELTEVKWAKCRYKTDSKRGELLIKTNIQSDQERREDKALFSPIEVKRLLTELGLEPLDFRTINK